MLNNLPQMHLKLIQKKKIQKQQYSPHSNSEINSQKEEKSVEVSKYIYIPPEQRNQIIDD